MSDKHAQMREMARDLIRDSVIEDAITQRIAQIVEFIHEDRIKPLQQDRDEALNQLDSARQTVDVLVKRLTDRMTKLAKAVQALDRIAGKAPYADDPYDIARDALEELKGDKP